MIARILLICLSALLPILGQDLRLVKALPLYELAVSGGIAPRFETGGITFRRSPGGEVVRNTYGFVKIGSQHLFYTGVNGTVVDPETGQLSQSIPADLMSAKLSLSGERMVGLLDQGKTLWSLYEGIPSQRNAAPWTDWMHLGWIHSADQLFFAPDDATRYPYPPYGFKGVMVVEIATDRVVKRLSLNLPESPEYIPSADGRWILGKVVPYTSYQGQNLRTSEWLRVDMPDKSQSDYVFNRDASWVAGFSSDFDSSDGQIALFIWNRKTKNFIWKGKTFGGPVAFSPNDAYLLTRAGYMLVSATGEIAFKDLKGTSGKFSPDGRSLVTIDDEAFYIYTLPKGSEPIFGVFQKPEPWSPPKPVKRIAPSAKKPLKKP